MSTRSPLRHAASTLAIYSLPLVAAFGVASFVGRTWGSEHVFENIPDTPKHFLLYALMALFVAGFGCVLCRRVRTGPILYGAFVAGAYGVWQEARQALTGASFEWRDLAADILGVLVAAALLYILGLAVRRRDYSRTVKRLRRLRR